MNKIILCSSRNIEKLKNDALYNKFIKNGLLKKISDNTIEQINNFSKKFKVIFYILDDDYEIIKTRLSTKILYLKIGEKNYLSKNIIYLKNLKFINPFFFQNNKYLSYLFTEKKFGFLKNINKKKIKIKKLLASEKKKYIFGKGLIGNQVLFLCNENNIKIDGFIDNNISSNIRKKIFNLQSIPTDSIIIISPGKSCSIILKQLRLLKYENIICLSDFFISLKNNESPESNYLNDLFKNKIKYLFLYLMLNDNKSRNVLNNIIHHRLSLKSYPLFRAYSKNKLQWFDKDLFKIITNAVYIDGGTFDGETIIDFIKANSSYLKIYGYDIDKNNVDLTKKNLSKFKNIKIINKGLSDNEKQVFYSSTGTMSSYISNKGKRRVLTDSLDRSINEKITHIKLDIEGEEMNAIKGSKKQIKKNKPFIAIAAYHKAEDLWKLQEIINNYRSDYKFYLRHYTEVSYETVLYCI